MKPWLGFLSLAVVGTLNAQHFADLPDPLVGTDSSYELSHGNTYPAVFLPFAMSNWTAETGDGGWPYQYSKDRIRGFRSTHRPSAWMFDWGPFSVMPMTGKLRLLPDERASKFRHRDEDARAYRYRVLLEDYGIQAEMAPTRHGGILRFTFPRAKQAWVVIDDSPGGAALHVDPETQTISGTNSSAPRSTASNFTLYFVAVFDHAFIVHGASDKAAWVGFSTRQGESVTVRVGTSLIGAEQARRNLDREIPRPDFDRVVADARAEWDRELGRIEIAGGAEAERRTFYTALYHAFQMPRMLTETDATGAEVHYSPYDGKVHSGPMFSDTGFWDTFRAEFPLLALLQPARDAEIIRAMLNAFDEGGWIPKWPNPAETNVMIGTHADSVIADAYAKGIRDYDVDKAYRALYKDATQTGSGNFEGRGGLEDYVRLGYVPADHGVPESVSRTLEYAYDDFCVATMAQALGKADDYRLFTGRSRNYRNVFDPSTGFMRGRTAAGAWVQPFDPLDWGGVFTEGLAMAVVGAARCAWAHRASRRARCVHSQTRRDVQHDLRLQGGRLRQSDPRDDRGKAAKLGPVRPRERARAPRRLSLRLRGPAVENAEACPRGDGPALQARTGWLAWRRRHRSDVGMVHLQRAGLLSCGPGKARLCAGDAVVRPRDDSPRERQDVHSRGGETRTR